MIRCGTDIIEISRIKKAIETNEPIKQNEEILKDKYGKFIMDKFENIITDTSNYQLKSMGNYNMFPKLSLKENNYFDIKDIFNQ